MVDRLLLGDPLLIHCCMRVDFHGGGHLGVPHQLLNYPHIVAGVSEQRTVGMAKSVPADPLCNPYPSRDWLKYFVAKAIRPYRLPAELLSAGKNPVGPFGVSADQPPLVKFGGH